MGNSALTCFRGRGQVRVVLLNGDVAEFKRPVTAGTVMRKYPQHVVLHCATESCSGLRRKIAVVKPDQALKVKHNCVYLIMPVQTVGNSRTFIESWVFFAINACNAKMQSRLRNKHMNNPKKRWWIHKVFAKYFRFPPVDVELDTESNKPLLGFEQPSTIQCRTASGHLQDWRPSLECIPESPCRSPDFNRVSSYSRYRRVDFL